MGYVRFDVDKIKDFVFESFKPMEVMGASEMIKVLDEGGDLLKKEFGREFPGVGMDVIYARGGGGLLRVDREEKEVCRWLRETFGEVVKGGALTVVSCGDGDFAGFPTAYDLLNYKLREEKHSKVLFSPPVGPVMFSKDESMRRCSGCGKRGAVEPVKFAPDEIFHYCGVCLAKREYGEKYGGGEVNTLEDLLLSIPGVKDSSHMLMIYGDLNEAGALFASMPDEEKLRLLSRRIFDCLNGVRDEIEKLLGRKGFKTLMPVAGGDDLVIFVHPAAFGLIKDILYGLEERLEKATGDLSHKKIKMNISLLAAKYNFPIHNLFNISEELLTLTKKAYYDVGSEDSGKPHYGFYRLEDGGIRPCEKDIYQKETFFALYDFARQLQRRSDIGMSSIYRLLDLLPVRRQGEGAAVEMKRSKEEELFNLAYFLARNEGLEKMLALREEGCVIKGSEEMAVSRDLWEDVIDMTTLFMATKEAE